MALHADLVLRPLFYGVEESQIYKYFRRISTQGVSGSQGETKSESKEEAAGGESKEGATEAAAGGSKKECPKLRLQYLASVLSNTPLKETMKWTAADFEKVEWRKIYTGYIRPLSLMFRALRKSYAIREHDETLFSLFKQYTEGCRDVLGVPFMKHKGLWHRTAHLILQASGIIVDCMS